MSGVQDHLPSEGSVDSQGRRAEHEGQALLGAEADALRQAKEVPGDFSGPTTCLVYH